MQSRRVGSLNPCCHLNTKQRVISHCILSGVSSIPSSVWGRRKGFLNKAQKVISVWGRRKGFPVDQQVSSVWGRRKGFQLFNRTQQVSSVWGRGRVSQLVNRTQKVSSVWGMKVSSVWGRTGTIEHDRSALENINFTKLLHCVGTNSATTWRELGRDLERTAASGRGVHVHTRKTLDDSYHSQLSYVETAFLKCGLHVNTRKTLDDSMFPFSALICRNGHHMSQSPFLKCGLHVYTRKTIVSILSSHM